MINEILLDIIVFIHFIFVLFMVLTPFIGNNYFLILHAIVTPFIMAHWYLNDNNCALTIAEKFVRQSINGTDTDPNDCITYNLIAPVYDFKKNNSEFTEFIYIATFVLWFISLYRLYYNWKTGKLNKLEHIVIY